MLIIWFLFFSPLPRIHLARWTWTSLIPLQGAPDYQITADWSYCFQEEVTGLNLPSAHFPNFSGTMHIMNWVINCVMLAKASELRERGTSKRKGQSREKLHRHGKNKMEGHCSFLWTTLGCKNKISAQEMHICCLTNMDTRGRKELQKAELKELVPTKTGWTLCNV